MLLRPEAHNDMELPIMDWTGHCLLIIAVTTLAANPAVAYPTPVDFDGKLLRWNINPAMPDVTWEVKTDSASELTYLKSIVVAASAVWNAAPKSYLNYREVGANEVAKVTINYATSIAGGDYAAGYALFDKSGTDGPVHCSIHIAVPASFDYESLSKTTLHEMGHCFGLGHTLMPQAIMSYSLTENSFALALDDEAAIASLYPNNGDPPRAPPGCTISNEEVETGATSPLVLAMLLFLPTLAAISTKNEGFYLRWWYKANMFAPGKQRGTKIYASADRVT